MAVGEVWHVHHKGNEVKIVCSDTLRRNGYSQDHASGGGGKYSDTTRWNEYRQEHASGGDISDTARSGKRRQRNVNASKHVERGKDRVLVELVLLPQAKGRYDLSAPEIVFPAALATRFTGSKILSILKRLGVRLAIAA